MNISEELIREVVAKVLQESMGAVKNAPDMERQVDPSGVIGIKTSSVKLEPFEGRDDVKLKAGDWITIPAHCRHRVESSSADALWLAVFGIVGGFAVPILTSSPPSARMSRTTRGTDGSGLRWYPKKPFTA